MGACPLTGPVWGDGNILLGGLGSDRLEGRGANDVLDGDRYVQVRISVRTNPADPATEIGTTDLMEHTYQAGNPHTLEADVAAGVIDPGNLVAVREVITPTAAQTAGNVDTAVFSGPEANYTVTTTGGDGTLGSPGSTTTVTDNVGADGTDTLRNIEQLAFSDTVVTNAPVIGVATAGNARATVTWTAPTVGVASSFNVKTLDVTTNPAGVQVGGLLTAPGTDTSLVVPGLTNGNKYVFQVSATNAQGTSPFSVASNVVIPAATIEPGTPPAPPAATVPGAPTGVTAVAGNAAATLAWTLPASDGGAQITGYEIRTFIGTATTPTRTLSVGTGTGAVVDGLINATGYTFDVAAINSAGTGARSARTAVTTPRTEFVVPTITARTPAAGAKSVSQTNNLTVTFSEPVANVTTGTVVLRLGTTVVPATVTYNNATRTATLNPNATLLADRTYSMAVSSVRDTAGNSMGFTSWQFTTGPAPTLLSTSPANGARGVARTANVTARFSEPITGVSTGTVVLRLGTTVIPAVVSYNNATRTVTLNPSVTLAANRTYTMAISSVRDLAGNPLGNRSWSFTTGTR
jgi:hypothetical protein